MIRKALLLGAAALLCSAPRPARPHHEGLIALVQKDGADRVLSDKTGPRSRLRLGLREGQGAPPSREEHPDSADHAVSVSADRFVVLARNKVAVKDGKRRRSTLLRPPRPAWRRPQRLPRERRARQSLAPVVSPAEVKARWPPNANCFSRPSTSRACPNKMKPILIAALILAGVRPTHSQDSPKPA